MRKVILTAFFCAFSLSSLFAQNIQEPEFVGEVNMINGATVTPLDKERVQIKSSAPVTLNGFAIRKAKDKMKIDGGQAACRVHAGDPFQLLVHAVDNDTDPTAIIKVFKLDATKNARKATMAQAGTFTATNNKLNYVEFTGKRFGKASYLLTLENPQPGEYGVTVSNPNHVDEKELIVLCFGID